MAATNATAGVATGAATARNATTKNTAPDGGAVTALAGALNASIVVVQNAAYAGCAYAAGDCRAPAQLRVGPRGYGPLLTKAV